MTVDGGAITMKVCRRWRFGERSATGVAPAVLLGPSPLESWLSIVGIFFSFLNSGLSLLRPIVLVHLRSFPRRLLHSLLRYEGMAGGFFRWFWFGFYSTDAAFRRDYGVRGARL